MKNDQKTYETIYGAPEGQDARIIAARAREVMAKDGVLVHVALDDSRVESLEGFLAFFAPDVEILKFPAWDCLPYDRVSPNHTVTAQRLSTLTGLLQWDVQQERKPRVLLTTINAVMQRVIARDVIRQNALSVAKGQAIDQQALFSFLQKNGYVRTETVREPGEYAVRGGIIDLFPSGQKHPLRLDLFGDELDSIRCFDPLTQRSLEKSDAFQLLPATEVFLDDESIANFRSGYRAHFGVARDDDPLYKAVSEGRRYNGMEHWQPLFFEQMETVFDYMPRRSVMMDHHALNSYDERAIQVRDFYQTRASLRDAAIASKKTTGGIYQPLPVEALYMEETEFFGVMQGAQLCSPFQSPQEKTQKDEAVKGRDFSDIRALPDGDVFAELKTHLLSLQCKALIATYSEGSKERLKGLLGNAGIGPLKDCAGANDLKTLKLGQIGIGVLPLEHGFVAADLAVMTEQDILGERMTRRSGKKRKADNFLTEVSALAPGDLVVHIDHGVGKFISLETLDAAGALHDCLKLEYAGGDRLYVPVENMEVLSRFGADEGTVQLDKLGGAGWQARKARVKKNLMEMAGKLMEIAAARTLRKAEKLDIAQDVYQRFAAHFPYQETEDQARAIDEVLASLSSEVPMDRLICGDVGFGKTEVAIRAAYVAAMAGTQVALVVPTTLLSRQHYKNFIARFKGTGLRVEQLSRLVSAKDTKTTKDGLSDGSVNIVIGTHALFSKDIKFAHLGLLIVDEEQRFGVKQKERLKELKSNVHVLTLSATPIPRTLQMSLSGIKEMSLITTPPVDRLAVRTFVLPYDSMVVREALLREHYRGGQSFYVCPRIKDMAELERALKDLVPEVKVITAHGQMTPAELEDRMSAFYEGRYEVLLATNIIESGIDIPSANTMIIHRADMFGLAQLYQIRGRIGRSKVRAYAYLTYPPLQKLNPQAQKRLEVMETLDTLGAGFQLASHDMDIRGAGNLLGDKQSGHIREVGAELYQQMLEEAVAGARAGTDMEEDAPEQWSPQINLGASVLIPEGYVTDLGVRMSLYRRLSSLGDAQEIEIFAAELIDRFGKLPHEVENLLQIVKIKQLCLRAGIATLDAGPKGAVFGFYNNTPPNVEGLMRWMQEKRGNVKLRPDQKVSVIRAWDKVDQRIQGVQSLMKELLCF